MSERTANLEVLGLRGEAQEWADDLALSLIEVVHQADADLSGEQREFHLPRLRKAFMALLTLFPVTTGNAMTRAKDAWGRPLMPDDDEEGGGK